MSLKRKKPVDEDFEEYDDVDMLETSENEEDFSDDEVLRFNDENKLSDDENELEGNDHGLEDDDHELEGDDDIPKTHLMSRRTLTMIRVMIRVKSLIITVKMTDSISSIVQKS
ncbi:hypothetical protein QQZ08_012096 [Neonectria magnoliae]|uniref:Uncharacterized protein n=1 Tax=Neonectria magnoliae TaxID=2732573 RepID=A0ABR1H538_9HYPO